MSKRPTITIRNWEKYNPRTDSKKPNWFRMDNTVATGEKFFSFDAEQKWIWVFILSMASQRNSGEFRLNLEYISKFTGIPIEKVYQTVQKLIDEDCINAPDGALDDHLRECRASHAQGTRNKRASHVQASPVESEVSQGDLPTTDGRTNGRTYMGDETSPQRSSSKAPRDSKKGNGEDLDPLREEIYEVYPRRGKGQNMGKGPGMRKLKGIHSKEKLERIKVASQNYAAAQKKNGNENTQYTMQFSTFLNNWEEWEKQEPEKPKKKLRFGGERKCSQNNKSIL